MVEYEQGFAEKLEKVRAHLPPHPQLSQFVVEGRIGKRNAPMGGSRYYGVNSAVFAVQLKDVAEVQLSLKVVFNVDNTTTMDISDSYENDVKITSNQSTRLPPHPNILWSLGSFVDTASKATLGDSWTEDSEFVRESSLMVLLPRMDRNLKDEIRDRVAKQEAEIAAAAAHAAAAAAGAEGGDAGAAGAPSSLRPATGPFFSDDEFLCVMVRLLSAVELLHKHRVVHRDIKPDNILLKGVASPDSGHRNAPLLVTLSDFGECLDLEEEEMVGFVMPFRMRGTPRGGAPAYLPPEVTSQTTGKGQSIDYSKSDVFACGMVAHNLLSGLLTDPFATAYSQDYSAELYCPLPEHVPVLLTDLVWSMLNPDALSRATIQEALATTRRCMSDATIKGTNSDDF
jgi:serine/threonine protein kinase